MTVVLAADAVTFAIGYKRLVDTITLEVGAGELVAIVGPNGAGKSTLLQLLAGELQPTSGAVELDGTPLGMLGPREVALRRSVMPQQTTLQFAFSVEDVVAMGRHPHRSSPAVDAEAVRQAMWEADIESLSGRRYPSLSGGERQRVTFARVLAQQSPVMLLDEPTSSLDLRHQEHLMATARAVADRGGTVVAVLHDLNLAAAYADRLVLLHQAQLVACGTPEEVLLHAPLEDVFGHPLATAIDAATGCINVAPTRPVRAPRRRDAVAVAAGPAVRQHS